MSVSVTDSEFSSILHHEKRLLREIGTDAYVAQAFNRMREMAKKQDARNAKLKGEEF